MIALVIDRGMLHLLASALEIVSRRCVAKSESWLGQQRVKLGCLSDEKFDRLAFGSGQNRSPSRAGQCRICRCLLLGCCDRRRNRRYAEVADIGNRFQPLLWRRQRHVRPTLRSRTSTFVGLGAAPASGQSVVIIRRWPASKKPAQQRNYPNIAIDQAFCWDEPSSRSHSPAARIRLLTSRTRTAARIFRFPKLTIGHIVARSMCHKSSRRTQ